MSKPTLFDFHGKAVRVVHNETGVWFVAADVANVLELKNIRQNIAEFPENEKGVCSVYTLGGEQSVAAVNETGLYRLIFQSRKQQAETFKTWVLGEVLPTIRKTGAYVVPGLVQTNRIPKTFAEALRLAADAVEMAAAAEEKLAEAGLVGLPQLSEGRQMRGAGQGQGEEVLELVRRVIRNEGLGKGCSTRVRCAALVPVARAAGLLVPLLGTVADVMAQVGTARPAAERKEQALHFADAQRHLSPLSRVLGKCSGERMEVDGGCYSFRRLSGARHSTFVIHRLA